MASAEASASTLGPRYAPDDPTLPQPWKGLIDGSSGVMYYWNPETNVTQYEKPASVAPPLPPGPSPAAPTPKLNPIPVARTSDGVQHPQQIQQVPPHSQFQGSHVGPGMQQQGQQLSSQPGQMPTHHGQIRPQNHMQNQGSFQHMQQMPNAAQGHFYPGSHMGNQHGYQFNPPQTQYGGYQQNMPPQGPQVPHQQEHKIGQVKRDGTEFHHGKQAGFSPANQHMMQQGQQQTPHLREQKDDVEFQQGKKAGFSPAQIQQPGGSSVNLQQTNPSLQVHQMGPGMMHVHQHQIRPPAVSKMGYEENHLARPGNENYGSNNNVQPQPQPQPQHPKLAPLPMGRNQQEMRMGDFPQNVAPGRLNGPGPPGGLYAHNSGTPPFQNNAFVRPPLAMMGPSDPNLSATEVYRQKHEVTASGEDVPAPFMTFESTGFPPEILQELCLAGFSAPTPIQAQTWSVALQSRDIVAIAKTGSGKTLGYLIPAFIHLRRRQNNPRNGPSVLVLSPTRELATQIQDEAIKFGRSSRVSCTCLYGGAPKGPQLKELEQGVDIVVATPGRLNDILEMKRIDFRQISLLVLDEADRMLDMGFEPQIRKIVNEIPPRRQTLMYTATWPKEVRKIASDLLVNPIQVNIGSVDELAANKSITQYVEMVPEMEKQRRLEQILRSQERGSKIIIFCSTKKLCDYLARSLGRNFGAAVIHGDKSQGERDWVLNQFRAGKSPVLVATDVAARGLDIRDIRIVINYDFPTGIEDYVHRIGRTGRAGATGIAYTFFSEQDWKHAPDLVKVLEGANQQVPPEVRDIASRGGPSYVKVNRYDSSSGGGGRWDSGGRGGSMRDSGGRGGMRDGGFAGRGGFSGRGGMRDGGGFGGRGGMRDGNFGGGGRGGGRDGSFGGGRFGNDRGGGRGPNDRFNNLDTRGGGGRARGRGRFDNRRDGPRDRSYSPSPDRVRTWRSRSRSRSRGRSYSRSRSRSWSRSRSPRSRSRSYGSSPRRSRSRSYERYEERKRTRVSKFDQVDVSVPTPNAEVAPKLGGVELVEQVPLVGGPDLGHSDTGPDPNNPPVEP